MQHALAVRVSDRLASVEEVADQAKPLAWARLGDRDRERATLHDRHRVEGPPVGPASGVVDRDDPRVAEASGQRGLGDELPGGLGVASDRQLDRQRASEPSVVDRTDLTHATAAEQTALAVALGLVELELAERGLEVLLGRVAVGTDVVEPATEPERGAADRGL